MEEQTLLCRVSCVEHPSFEEPALLEVEIDASGRFRKHSRHTQQESWAESLDVGVDCTQIAGVESDGDAVALKDPLGEALHDVGEREEGEVHVRLRSSVGEAVDAGWRVFSKEMGMGRSGGGGGG